MKTVYPEPQRAGRTAKGGSNCVRLHYPPVLNCENNCDKRRVERGRAHAVSSRRGRGTRAVRAAEGLRQLLPLLPLLPLLLPSLNGAEESGAVPFIRDKAEAGWDGGNISAWVTIVIRGWSMFSHDGTWPLVTMYTWRTHGAYLLGWR